MKIRDKLIVCAIIIGLSYYVLDAFIDYLLFYEDLSFFQILVLKVPIAELYNRLIGITAILIFGIIISGFMADLQTDRHLTIRKPENVKDEMIFDPNLMVKLAHQIRIPMNAIVGFSDLLKDPSLSVQSRQTYINHINSSGKYLLSLITNMVDITRLEMGQLPVNKKNFSLNELMQEIHNDFEKRKKESGRTEVGIVLRKGIREGDFTFHTDPDRLRQVISNLLENALKFTEEGFIEFGYKKPDGNELEFYVKDTGSGFSGERLEVIFKRFRNMSDNQIHPFDSAALRLNIAKNLVCLLGGGMWAESRIGQGSTFRFTISGKSYEEIIEKEKIEKKETGQKNWKNKTILIAEDIESNFIYLHEILKPTEARLIWAKNGREAVTHCQKNDRIDIVLMDILMPEMDGYEALEKIKGINEDLPVVAQTAYSLEGETDRTQTERFDDYLTKPIWSNHLLSTLGKYLNQ